MSLFSKREQLEFAWRNCSEFALSMHPLERLSFNFSPKDLIEYLQEHQEICEILISQSDDKRYSPSSILIPSKSGFIVGMFNSNSKFEFERTQLFENIVDAAADYILLNWKLPRLRSAQTEHKLRRQWRDKNILLLDSDSVVFDEI